MYDITSPELANLRPQGKIVINQLKKLNIPVEKYNIIYLEGCNTDIKTINNDRIDQWNDVRSIIGDDGRVYLACSATSEPGQFYTDRPLNVDGAARVAIGYHEKAWQIGWHKTQRALVQVGNLKIHRDLNKDGFRTGDRIFVGSEYGINQHTTGNSGSDNSPGTVGKWSAGCLVGRYSQTHYGLFMPMCVQMAAGQSDYRFSSTVLDASAFL